jgi:hypothetical protein
MPSRTSMPDTIIQTLHLPPPHLALSSGSDGFQDQIGGPDVLERPHLMCHERHVLSGRPHHLWGDGGDTASIPHQACIIQNLSIG